MRKCKWCGKEFKYYGGTSGKDYVNKNGDIFCCNKCAEEYTASKGK